MDPRDNYWTRARASGLSRRRFLYGSGVLAAGSAAVLAGCGDDDDDGGEATPSTGGTQATSASTGTPQAASTTAAASAGKRGGTIITSKASPDTGLDPAITVTNPLHPAKAYSHILQYNLSENKFYLDLAEKFEQADPTTMVFTLRPGLKFAPQVANGRALTAADVAFSYGRFPGTLKNFGSEVNGLQWNWMDSFETPDERTLKIKLKAPYASAIPTMGSSAFAVVAKELVEANGGKLSDVMNAGAGPYVMTKRDSSGTRYERNPNYYKHSPAVGTFVEDGPYIDVWDEVIIQDLAAVEARFLAGDTHIYTQAVDKLKAEEFKSNKNVSVVKATFPGNLQMQLDNEKWAAHPKLREALSLSIDRNKYIQSIHLGEGQLGSPVGPIFDSVLTQAELKDLQKFDPARAKQLWAEGNGNTVFPNGLRTIAATFAPSTNVDFLKREIEANLGVKVTVSPADLAAYVSIATARDKQWEIFVASEFSLVTIPDYNALTFYIPTGYGAIFGNQRLDSQTKENADFAKTALDKFNQQAQELDPAKRKQLLKDMQTYFLKEFRPALPMPVAQFQYAAHSNKLKNYPEKEFPYGNAGSGAYRVHNLSLA
ncbi:MAG: ABC transporter substrate-binding protein [Dehalococcoidia bacterium]